MTLRILAKVLLHVWSYDFYDMTSSTGKQRRHMINMFIIQNNQPFSSYDVKFYHFMKNSNTKIIIDMLINSKSEIILLYLRITIKC